MAGIPIAFNDVLHQYGGGSLHKRFKMKRQGRDPLSQPGGGGVSTPGASSTDAGNGGNSLSLGRPSDTASPTDDDDEEESTTSERECIIPLYFPSLVRFLPSMKFEKAWPRAAVKTRAVHSF